ncbi:MAG: right-handed parallel beta-helix repeat-containing protein [Bacteroidota bacterium]|nr:right-handed parallel beta-helix repeat-containing protein [Bacteroidota bacterium]
MKRIYMLLFCSLFIQLNYLQAKDVSGIINTNTTWTLDNSPYVVTGNLTINPGDTLTIKDNVIVKINSNLGIYVYGALKASKTSFTSNLTPKQKGDWNCIEVGNGNYAGNVIMDTCTLEYGGKGNDGTIYAYNGTAKITGTSINNSSSAGIELQSASVVTLQNTSISGCDWPIIYTSNGLLHNNGGNNFTGNKHDAAYVYFTSLSANWTLEKLPVPYVFYSSFTIYSGGKLVVSSGSSIKSDDWFYVDGTLKAAATGDERIIFTSARNDNVGGDTNADGVATIPAVQSWGGIYFRGTSVDTACVLRKCDITFGGSGNHGGIIVENASPTIESCLMANNYYGAEIRGVSSPGFRRNTMASSKVVPIAMSFDSSPDFTDNIFSFSDNEYDAIGLLGGTLGANSRLPQRDVTTIKNVTYLLLGELTIPEDYTLTIDSGIVIKSPYYYYGIVVKGALVANGRSGNEIIFTSAKDDNHGNPKDTNKDGTQTNPSRTDWSGLVFEGTSDDTKCLLNYCQIKYASSYSRYYPPQNISGGAVSLVNASPKISHCIIKDMTYGLYAYQASNPVVDNTEFTNALYTPIALSVSSNPTFTNITFVNNAWTALGIIGEKLGINGTIGKRNIAGFNNITYVLLSDLTINSGINVTINPGIVLKMQDDILVEGGLKAMGLSNDSIIFTSINDDNYGVPNDTRSDGNAVAPAKGNWGTIQFKGTTDDVFSTFNYCKLLYGNRSSDRGMLTFTDAGNTISNTTISDANHYGIRIEGSSTPDLTNHVLIMNCRLDPIAMSLTSNPKFNFTSPLFNNKANGSNGIKIIEGNLSTNASLVKRSVGELVNVAYIIDNLTIMPNTTLTVGAGVVIKFNSYYHGIIVNGALIANGADEQIVFTSISDDSKGGDTNGDGNSSSPAKGNWDDIQFNSSNLAASNLLRNCVFNYGGSGYGGDGSYKDYGLIKVFDATVLVDHCRIEHSNTSAIGVFGSAAPIIQHTEINNISYTPVTLSLFSNPTFNDITTSNIGINAIGVARENYAVDATVPIRNFAGYSNMTYYFYGTCSVNSGTRITIPKGLVFKSNGTSILDVSGRLTVNGTATEPVVFTHQYDDAYGNPGDTNNNGSATTPSSNNGYSLTFEDISNDSSSVNNAIFRYFDRGIQLLQAAPSISNCLFNQCKWGVVLNGVSKPKIDYCRFENLNYTPICLSLVSYPASSVGNTISGTTYKAIGVISEELVQDAVLAKKDFAGINNIPYYFYGNYAIGTSVTLTIDPGVVCKFNEWAQFTVKRGLLALGGAAPEQTIVFTDYRDDFYGGDTNSDGDATNPASGYHWYGIDFQDVALDNLCKLNHCVIKYAGYYSTTDGAVTMTAASPTITHCLLTNNKNGVVANGASNPLIDSCDIYNNANFAVNNVNKSFLIKAEHCWWGDNSGPAHATNPAGKGGKVSDMVDFDPWRQTGASVPLMGDVSLNGSVQAYDASQVLQYVVGSLTLSGLQQSVADVSDDGSITSFDASLILRYVAGIDNTFPAERMAQQPVLSYGELTANADGSFTIPLLVDHASGSYSLDIVSAFDAACIEPVSLTSGNDLADRLMAYNFDKTAGKLRIAIAGTSVLGDQVEAARFTFRLSGSYAGKEETTFGMDKFLSNETDQTPYAIPKVIKISDLVTGLNSMEPANLLTVYPNPVKTNAEVRYSVLTDGTPVTILLIDVTGKTSAVVTAAVHSAGTYTVGLNNLKAGMYLLKLVSGTRQQIVKLIAE